MLSNRRRIKGSQVFDWLFRVHSSWNERALVNLSKGLLPQGSSPFVIVHSGGVCTSG